MKTKIAVLILVTGALLTTHASAQVEPVSSESVRIAVQHICPVSGQKLGEQSAPVKAKIGEEEVFLCCQGCLTGKVKPEHWATIHQNMAAAQGECPVMENKLPKKPKWTIVNGRMFYVCCPPCIDDIKADPEKYTKKLDALYMASLKTPKKLDSQ